MSQNEKPQPSRRDFLRTAAVTTVAATAASSMPTTAEGMRRVLGANDRLHTAHVGLGGQGSTHLRLLKENADSNLKNNTEAIALCDLYKRRLNAAAATAGLKESQTFGDFKKMLEIKDIDAVWVTTSDQWHAPVALAAMEAGKHVYIEKPMCKTMEENKALYDTAKRTKRIVQVGSQGCSDEKWHVAGRVVKSGKIGKVVMGQGSYCRNSKDGEWNYYAIDKDAGPSAAGEAHIDWETFRRGQGPAEFDPDRFFRWRKYYAYGNGIMGDLLPHRLHPLFIAMNLPTTGTAGFPTRVASLGGTYVQKINPETKKLDREVPDFTNLIVDFPEECSIMVLGSVINEQGWQDMIRGNKASLFFGGNGVEIKPERVWADEVEEGVEPINGPGEDIAIHEKNFLDCIRENKVPNCNIDIAVRVQTMISLGDMAFQKGKTMHFDAATWKVWG